MVTFFLWREGGGRGEAGEDCNFELRKNCKNFNIWDDVIRHFIWQFVSKKEVAKYTSLQSVVNVTLPSVDT